MRAIIGLIFAVVAPIALLGCATEAQRRATTMRSEIIAARGRPEMKLQVLVKLVMNYLLLAPFAQAADRSGNYMVLGQGTISCGRWISDRSRDNAWAEVAWLLGYLTAYNRNDWPGTNVASGTDSDGSFAWIDNYCRAAPLDDMATAAFRLAGFLASRGSQSTTLRQR